LQAEVSNYKKALGKSLGGLDFGDLDLAVVQTPKFTDQNLLLAVGSLKTEVSLQKKHKLGIFFTQKYNF
jgi:hypothetical protein